jgi:hypothetical protein
VPRLRFRNRDDVDAGGPLTLPLVQSSSNIFSRIGDIAIDGFDFEFGGAGMAWDSANSRLYMTGLRTDGSVGRLTLPSSVTTGSAATDVAPVVISGSWGPTQASVVTGSLVYGGELYVARSVDYDANADQSGWIKKMNLSMGAQGSINTMSAGGTYVRMLSGAMGHIPSEWQSLLGGPCFTTGCRMSIVTNAQPGYGFAVFDPANVSSGGGSVSVTKLINYEHVSPSDSSRSLEPVSGYHTSYAAYPKNASGGTDYYSVANAFLGTAFIHPGSRSLLFVTCHGYGAADNGCRPGSSVHNDPNRIQVVAYDLADLVDVKNGQANTWDPRPYAWWELPNWTAAWGACVGNPSPGPCSGNFCYLPDRGWLIGLADGTSGFPTLEQIQVWTVASL